MMYGDLIQRLEALTGPDREVDHTIQVRLINKAYGAYESEAAWIKAAVRYNWGTPRYTGSLDAADRFRQAVLPGSRVVLSQLPEKWSACLYLPGKLLRTDTFLHPCAPIAILIATLRAKEAQSA